MIAASALLFYEGADAHVLRTVAGAVAGVLFVALVSRLLAARPDARFEALTTADARKAVLLVAVMTVHSSAEGIGVGVSFGGGESLGLVTALAIAIHNIPERPRDQPCPRPWWRARAPCGRLERSFEPAPAAFAFVAFFDGLVPLGLGFAGGAMLWMVVTRVVPDALRASSRRAVVGALAGSTVAMLALEWLLLS